MSSQTMERVIHWIHRHRPRVVDITGGAPEMNPHFKDLVRSARAAGCEVIDRNNLTILEEPGFEDLHSFLAENQVEVIASLPCYEPENVHRQRGQGVFERSIRALRKLNEVGYGGVSLKLNLVYNPLGPTLPPPQEALEADYRKALLQEHGVQFNRLFTLTNQPIARFAEDLKAKGQWEAYMSLLANAFNPATLEGLMCRSTINVGYEGEVFDCDFNQMLGLQLAGNQATYLWDIDPDGWLRLPVVTGPHCLACTAGAGSSCTGALSTSA
jgi:radical SAM/Cys-rich protein